MPRNILKRDSISSKQSRFKTILCVFNSWEVKVPQCEGKKP